MDVVKRLISAKKYLFSNKANREFSEIQTEVLISSMQKLVRDNNLSFEAINDLVQSICTSWDLRQEIDKDNNER